MFCLLHCLNTLATLGQPIAFIYHFPNGLVYFSVSWKNLLDGRFLPKTSIILHNENKLYSVTVKLTHNQSCIMLSKRQYVHKKSP
jgi:hypothetical protein